MAHLQTQLAQLLTILYEILSVSDLLWCPMGTTFLIISSKIFLKLFIPFEM